MSDRPITSAEFAKLADPPVKASTVRQWNARFGDFPRPVETYGGIPLYDAAEARAWLCKHDRLTETLTPICSACLRIRTPEGEWVEGELTGPRTDGVCGPFVFAEEPVPS